MTVHLKFILETSESESDERYSLDRVLLKHISFVVDDRWNGSFPVPTIPLTINKEGYMFAQYSLE